jgi:formylglycine-generating enzyme required for sulfatase activity/tRNA A-37 threonylcarbamoyl transferase component Bud32
VSTVDSKAADMSHEVLGTLTRGEALGRYIVIELLGEGATGVVYAAYDPELDRKVAIKILRRQTDGVDETRRQGRFVREAKAIARLAHSNVVGIFDVGVDHGRVFLAMEYLAGGTLREWMGAAKRSWREIVAMFVEVGRGLAAAHAEGLVHRDFKPDNVLLDRAGMPKVADFGLARLAGPQGGAESGDQLPAHADSSSDVISSEKTPLTRTGALAGTPAYMAPEQFRGKNTDGRTDQFAFCVALHEALFGIRPFDEDTVFELADSVIRERIKPPPKNANVPGWVRRSLLRGLRANPEQRYAKIEDLLATLTADPVARVRKIAVVAVVATVLGTTFAGLYRRSERRRVEFERRVATKLNEGRQALGSADEISRRLTDTRNRAFAAFDGARPEEAESIWSEARSNAAKLEATLKRAQSVLEAALTLDQANDQALASLGQAIFQRALLAESEFRSADVARHLEQMERLSAGPELMARWNQPGTVDVRTNQDGVRVVIERYEPAVDEAGSRLLPVRVGEPFVTPSEPRPLPPGSYRLTALKTGFTETRYPFVVRRGQPLKITLSLVGTAETPSNFVYVPEGPFLYGDADEDWRVAFLNAAPIHERTTGAFFISVRETTFGEWLAFLADLSPAERQLRVPSSIAVQGSAALEGSPEKGWTLDLNISGQRVKARQGSPIVFSSRKTRASQDWLRTPVVGVSQRDMQAYVEWLSRTGRVPGARFCSEVEWERAARGADGRSYPGSPSRLAGDDANIDVAYGRVRGSYGPDEGGAHPRSDSPFGIADMAGNVWEVVSASDQASEFLMRGGSYYQAFMSARSTNREPIDVGLRSFLLGLRVCAAKK